MCGGGGEGWKCECVYREVARLDFGCQNHTICTINVSCKFLACLQEIEYQYAGLDGQNIILLPWELINNVGYKQTLLGSTVISHSNY